MFESDGSGSEADQLEKDAIIGGETELGNGQGDSSKTMNRGKGRGIGRDGPYAEMDPVQASPQVERKTSPGQQD